MQTVVVSGMRASKKRHEIEYKKDALAVSARNCLQGLRMRSTEISTTLLSIAFIQLNRFSCRRLCSKRKCTTFRHRTRRSSMPVPKFPRVFRQPRSPHRCIRPEFPPDAGATNLTPQAVKRALAGGCSDAAIQESLRKRSFSIPLRSAEIFA